jgi:hypothetical protein
MTNSSMRRSSRSAWGSLPVAVVAAWVGAGCCGPNLEEVIKKHQPAIEAKIVPLASIRDQVVRIPPLQEDTVTHSGAPLTLALANVETNPANTSLCYAEDLKSPEELGFVFNRIENTGSLNQCASVVRRGHEVFDPATPDDLLSRPFGFSAESMFKRCEAVTTLLVIRTLEFIEPGTPEPVNSAFTPNPSICAPSASTQLAGPDSGASDSASPNEIRLRFGGGRLRAEVLVFALEGARLEGGFRVEAASSVRVTGSNVKSDLADQLRAAIAAGLKAHVPGATVRL